MSGSDMDVELNWEEINGKKPRGDETWGRGIPLSDFLRQD